MTRAVLTGVTGQDGSYLSERLLAAGCEVHALVRGSEAREIDSRIVQHAGDLSDLASLDALVQLVEPEVIFNLAGMSSVALSWSEPGLTAQVTGAAVAQLLQSAWSLQKRAGREVRFIQASSSEIFAGTKESPQTERTALCPITPYGAAKTFAHNMVQVYRNRGLFASAAILYNHESPRRPETFVTRKITRAAAKIASGIDEMLVLGNLDARRDWGWAPDYVDALVRMSAAELPDDFVVATGVSHSVWEFTAAAFVAAGVEEWQSYVTTDPTYARPTDAAEMLGNPAKAREVLGWNSTITFEELVARMVANDLQILNDL